MLAGLLFHTCVALARHKCPAWSTLVSSTLRTCVDQTVVMNKTSTLCVSSIKLKSNAVRNNHKVEVDRLHGSAGVILGACNLYLMLI